jgi:hypothetical protein
VQLLNPKITPYHIVVGNIASIDIVFTDIHLIGSASGWDVAERVRADRPNVSVLYTSGKSIDRGRCVPGSAFLAKPYLYDAVVNACDRLRSK